MPHLQLLYLNNDTQMKESDIFLMFHSHLYGLHSDVCLPYSKLLKEKVQAHTGEGDVIIEIPTECNFSATVFQNFMQLFFGF